MLAFWWLLIIGILTGLVTRTIVGGEAYGLVADALFGVTGAFAVDWMLGVAAHTTISWSTSTLFTIWGAAALPLLAHVFARGQTARQHQETLIDVSLFKSDAGELPPAVEAVIQGKKFVSKRLAGFR